jgi:L-asparaginase II
MTLLLVENVRNDIVESAHRVSLAVVRADGELYASSGDPHLVTYMRSTAKPFQALPLVQDGAYERFAMSQPELALACASHNSELHQVALVGAFLARLGLTEDDLACGPHRPLGLVFSEPPLDPEQLAAPSPLASNCSGKHAGMLALALHHGWDTAGYELSGHPVQARIKREMARWTGLTESEIMEGIDGCTTVSFAIPLIHMASALVRLMRSDGEAEQTVVQAMLGHPEHVAGTRRFGTELMQAFPGEVIAKVGAEGVFLAALKGRGLGIALKVEDGDAPAAVVALVAVLDQLGLEPKPSALLARFAEPAICNTRGVPVGHRRAGGALSFV